MVIVKSLQQPEQGYAHRVHRKKRKKHFKSQRARKEYLRYKATKQSYENTMDSEGQRDTGVGEIVI